MTCLLYAAACWPVVAVILAAILCRLTHNAKVRDRSFEA